MSYLLAQSNYNYRRDRKLVRNLRQEPKSDRLLGVTLYAIGRRTLDTARLEEAVTAYREALKERTHERVPLDWAQTQANLDDALEALGVISIKSARLEEAAIAYREALKEYSRQRVPLRWRRLEQHRTGRRGCCHLS